MMEKHPETIEGPQIIPWEPLGQIEPKELPEPSEKYPGPWEDNSRGGGHVDILDGQGRYFAHVYIWDNQDWRVLYRKVKASMAWAIENKVPITKELAVRQLKGMMDDHVKKLDDERRPFEAWVRLIEGYAR